MTKDRLGAVDGMLKAIYDVDPGMVERLRRDPVLREWKVLGGLAAYEGVKEMEPCPCAGAEPEVCECEHGKSHVVERECGRCRGAGEVWTGRWVRRPVDRRTRRGARLHAIFRGQGWERIHMFEYGSPIASALNAAVPLYRRLGREKP